MMMIPTEMAKMTLMMIKRKRRVRRAKKMKCRSAQMVSLKTANSNESTRIINDLIAITKKL